MGEEDHWLNDPRFADDLKRGDNGPVISERMARWCAERTTQEAVDTLGRAISPAGPVLSPQQALDHPHIRATGFMQDVDYPGLPKPAPTVRAAVRLSETPGEIVSRPPTLGEHTDRVLADIGYDADAIAALRKNGIISMPRPMTWRLVQLRSGGASPNRSLDISCMTLLSIPANPIPEGALAGTIGTPDRATLRFARWAAPAEAAGGPSASSPGAASTSRNIRNGAGSAPARLCGGCHRLAGTGAFITRALRNPLKGHVQNFSEYQIDVAAFVKQVVLPDCPPPYFALAHSMGGAVMLRVAHAGFEMFGYASCSARR